MTIKNVYLYVLDTMADWEPGYVIAELNTGRYFADRTQRRPVRTVAATAGPVRTLGGVTITPDLTVDQLSPDGAALLLLPGADTWADPQHKPVLDAVSAFLAAG